MYASKLTGTLIDTTAPLGSRLFMAEFEREVAAEVRARTIEDAVDSYLRLDEPPYDLGPTLEESVDRFRDYIAGLDIARARALA